MGGGLGVRMRVAGGEVGGITGVGMWKLRLGKIKHSSHLWMRGCQITSMFFCYLPFIFLPGMVIISFLLLLTKFSYSPKGTWLVMNTWVSNGLLQYCLNGRRENYNYMTYRWGYLSRTTSWLELWSCRKVCWHVKELDILTYKSTLMLLPGRL